VKGHAVIIRNSDGAEKLYPVDWDESDPEGDPSFIWTDGNFACDCNRHDFFTGEPYSPDRAHFPCGDTAYRVREFRLADGRVIPCDAPH
jgi:hypothetical protein